ncbi:MAG: DNA polymerase III subunit delta' [Coriobacteriales bacterium]|jgi:DNA polymerase-3 subunit delta'|nr:DNA polymerase III subunit delta' [Coriobacteriales bacterium]
MSEQAGARAAQAAQTAAARAVNPPFDSLVGQPLVAQFLTAAVAGARLSHAYLFMGPVGSGKTAAAQALAQAILCKQNGCGACDDCIRVARGTHPDVHIVEPLGANGYVSEQIHEVIHDAALAPVRASSKVYIITRADLLQGSPANAFLKTLEEPLASVVFILLARTRDSVLGTIQSRCQVLAFRTIPSNEAEQLLCSLTGVDQTLARIALAAVGGSVHRAQEFLGQSARRDARIKTIETIEQLAQADDYELLQAARELLVALKAPLDSLKIAQEQELIERKDYLSKGAMTQLEQNHKRSLTARERAAVAEAFCIMRSWLRDCLLQRLGTKEPIVNSDFHYNIELTAPRVDEPSLTRALLAIDKAEQQLHYNVSVQLALEVLLFSLREELRGTG